MPVHVLVWLSYCNGPVCPERARDKFQTSSNVEEGAFQYRMFNSGAVTSVQDDTMPARSASDPNPDPTATVDSPDLDRHMATPVKYKSVGVPDAPGKVYGSTNKTGLRPQIAAACQRVRLYGGHHIPCSVQEARGGAP